MTTAQRIKCTLALEKENKCKIISNAAMIFNEGNAILLELRQSSLNHSRNYLFRIMKRRSLLIGEDRINTKCIPTTAIKFTILNNFRFTRCV